MSVSFLNKKTMPVGVGQLLSDANITAVTGAPSTNTYTISGVNYKSYVWIGSGSITFDAVGLVDFLVIGGGGAGGVDNGAGQSYGGGGGGYRCSLQTELSGGGGTNYEKPFITNAGVAASIIVGAGGGLADPAPRGGDSVFGYIVSNGGGGGGGSAGNTVGHNGGSGGGAFASAGKGMLLQGYDAFPNGANSGGAGAGGANVTLTGGIGVTSTIVDGSTGVSRGGGGGTQSGLGSGGGGNGGITGVQGTAGTANTGGGGGGSGGGTLQNAGGSGLVVIRVLA